MWQQCNQMLHNEGTTIHRHKMDALDNEIREEMNTGLDELNERYLHLFNGTLQAQLDKSTSQKCMWIMNIWSA
jgi:hypothetical protein